MGWTDRDGCHIWACVKCGARDPAAENSKQNAKHIPGDWGNQKQLCTVCGHVMGTDTKAPVLEGLKDGESYTVEDTLDGKPGAYTFTVSDPAASGETSSGIKSVTINGEPQDGPTYRLSAPDGGNNDAGAGYTVVATDNAGNETTATVRTYRRHHVKVISPDGKKTYADLMLPHNEYLVLQIRLPAGVSATLTDEADGTKIPYDKEKGEFRVGLITKNRTLVLNYSTKHPKVELRLGTGQYFTGYNADSDEPYYLKGASMDGNSYQIGMWVDTDAKPGYYLSSPNRYTQEELAALDESLWKEYKIAEATPGSIVLPFILITIDAAAYEENGGWYVYAKATNPTGTTFVSTPNIIIDVENPKAIDLSTGKELENYGKYYGNLRFKVEDSSPVTVRCHTSPSGKAELLTPDENGVYTIPAEYDNSIQHTLIIEDACGNVASYRSFKVFWNYLTNVREKDHWDVAPAQPIRISREQNLKEELSKVQIGVFAADTSGFIPVEVSWEIPADYDPQSQREQTFTVNGTVILEGTGARCNSGLDVITRPGEEWKKNISVQVTVEGDPQYKVTVQDCENGRVKVVNAAGTAEDGTPLFFKGELVMLSIDPDEGYMLSTLSVNGNPAAVAVGDDTYTFTQPEGDVTITAAFEMRNEHTVAFDANGGSEPEDLPEEVTTAMPAKKVLHGSEYYLPECEFIAPVGKQFKAWQIDGTEYPVNAPVTVTADITVKALWEDAPPAPAEYTVTVTTEGNGTASASHAKAAAGTTITLTATPNEGYHLKEWEVMSGGVTIKDDKFLMPNDNVEVKAIFEKDAPPAPTEHTVTVTSGGNGAASASPAKAVAGAEITLTAKPDEGYRFKEWEVMSGNVTIKDDKFTMPSANVEVRAIFEKDAPPVPTEFTITVKTDGNGTASASHAKAVVGTEIRLTATPKEGYHFKEWQVISGNVTIKDNKFTMPDGNVEVKAIFEKDAPTEFTITFDGNGGTPSVDSMTTIDQKLSSLPRASRRGSYRFLGWYLADGAEITTDTVFSANTIVYAHWTYTGGGGSSGYSYYTIKATAGTGGSISPSGSISVREGRDQTFTITPDKGYAVANVKIDGKSIGAVKSYTFENVSRTHTIEVIFMKANGNPQTGVFVDVATGSYYEDAVDWAVENGITKGTDDTHFSPDGICTRAQAVTFLWRTAGSPASKTSTMPFTDVPVGSYYYDAVLWAVENGITKGTSDTTFSPNMTCSRAQIVTFLWRSEKSPAAGTANPFADVKSTAYYADAVLWAVREDITKGTTNTTFSPDADCTRAQIVTFLWRSKK